MPRFTENLGVVREIEKRLLPEGRQRKEGRHNPKPMARLH